MAAYEADDVVARDLWVGADVRWNGPETVRRGVRLRPGDRAVVVDAGRHHLTSFGSVYSPPGRRPPRPGRGVTIRLSGAEVPVPRQHLELLPPDHPLAPEPDGTQASWWLEHLDSWGTHGIPVSSFVPSGFPAVCQVLQASTGELDALTASALVDLLGRATTTPDDVFVAVWEGWGDVPPQRFPGAAHLDTQNRGHFLLRGPLTGVLSSVAVSGHDRPTSGLWWPADRAWFTATEIDLHWTFVAGETGLVDRLIDDERLDVARSSFDAPANRTAGPR